MTHAELKGRIDAFVSETKALADLLDSTTASGPELATDAHNGSANDAARQLAKTFDVIRKQLATAEFDSYVSRLTRPIR